MKRYKFTIVAETEADFNSKILDNTQKILEEEFIIGKKGDKQKIRVKWEKGFQFNDDYQGFNIVQYIEGKNKKDVIRKLKTLGIKPKNVSDESSNKLGNELGNELGDNLAENQQIIKYKRRKNASI